MAANVLCIQAERACWGQRRGNSERQQARETMRAEGVIERVNAGLLSMKTEDETWLIQIPRGAETSYAAVAKRDWLKSGLYVSFQGNFTSKGKATAPVRELRIFQPDRSTRMGAFPEERLERGNLFRDPNERQKSTAPQSQVVNVTGRLSSLKGNKLTVIAGRAGKVQVELLPAATISVSAANHQMARPGDRVRVDAWYPTGQKAGRKAIAMRVAVTAAKPLTSAKRKPRKQADKDAPKKDATDKDQKASEAKQADAKKDGAS